jgi:DNA-binding transcriptional regulator YiaG
MVEVKPMSGFEFKRFRVCRLMLQQRRLASMLGVTRETISVWEHSDRVPVVASLAIKEIERLVNISRDWS